MLYVVLEFLFNCLVHGLISVLTLGFIYVDVNLNLKAHTIKLSKLSLTEWLNIIFTGNKMPID